MQSDRVVLDLRDVPDAPRTTARDWPMLIVTVLALLLSGMPQPEMAASEWRDA